MATADQALAGIKLRCHWPSTNAPISDANLLLLADQEIVGSLWPMLVASQGDYYLSYLDHAITADKARYRLPKKSYGPIKDVLIVDSNGAEAHVDAMNIEELGQEPQSNRKFLHFIDGDFLGLYPTPSTTQDTLRIRFYRHPNALALTTTSRQISALTSATRLTLSAAISGTGWTTGTDVDIIGSGNAHQVLSEDIDLTGTGASTIDMASYPSTIEVGDWVATAGQTPLVPLPDFLVPLLMTRVALQALNGAGDAEAFDRMFKLGDLLERGARTVLEPRSEAAPRVIVPTHSAHRAKRSYA